MPGLVVDDGDDATRARAERILRGGVGIATRRKGADVQRGVIRGAPDLVEVPVVGAEQGAHRAMGSHTWRAARRVNVAGQRPCCVGCAALQPKRACNEAQNHEQNQQWSPVPREPAVLHKKSQWFHFLVSFLLSEQVLFLFQFQEEKQIRALSSRSAASAKRDGREKFHLPCSFIESMCLFSR